MVKLLHERRFDEATQTSTIEWQDGFCPRCGDDEGFTKDADGAHRCCKCGARFCAACGVKMSVHFSCVVTE